MKNIKNQIEKNIQYTFFPYIFVITEYNLFS